MTYARAVPAPILVNVTPGSDGLVPGLNVIASGIRSPYPACCIAVTSNSRGSRVRPRYAIADAGITYVCPRSVTTLSCAAGPLSAVRTIAAVGTSVTLRDSITRSPVTSVTT